MTQQHMNVDTLFTAETAGVYLITCVGSGMLYCGQTRDMRFRARDHHLAMLRGRHDSKSMNRDFFRYGQDSFLFTVMHFEPDRAKALLLEGMAITSLQRRRMAYNSKVSRFGRMIRLSDESYAEYDKSILSLASSLIANHMAPNTFPLAIAAG